MIFEGEMGENSKHRSWSPDHRTAPSRFTDNPPPARRDSNPPPHPQGRGGNRSYRNRTRRDPYLRIDNRRLYRSDLEEMDDAELEDIVARLETDNESIKTDLPQLTGDAEIKARDKKRFNEQWIDTIRNELLAEERRDGEPRNFEEGDYGDYSGDDEPLECEERPVFKKTSDAGIPPEEMYPRILAAINKHLSPELVAIILADATNAIE